MKSVFLTKLLNLKIDEGLGTGEKIGDHLKITNDRKRIEGLLKTVYRPLLGSMEVNSLLSGDPVIFSEREIPDQLTPQQFLVSQFREAQSFLETAWVVLDNSINFELGFLLYEDGKTFRADSNLISVQNTTARGERVLTCITREELRTIRTLHLKRATPLESSVFAPTTQLTAKYPRFTRALYFICAAREECDIAIKVAHYCTAFETLFSSSQTELAHQLSERISFYLFDSPEERIQNYKKLKGAYGLRSKVVHGSTFQESKLKASIDISEYCDLIARMICHKAFFDEDAGSLFVKGPDEFEEAILRLIFGFPVEKNS